MNPDEPLYTADEAMGWPEAVLIVLGTGALIVVAAAVLVQMPL